MVPPDTSITDLSRGSGDAASPDGNPTDSCAPHANSKSPVTSPGFVVVGLPVPSIRFVGLSVLSVEVVGILLDKTVPVKQEVVS